MPFLSNGNPASSGGKSGDDGCARRRAGSSTSTRTRGASSLNTPTPACSGFGHGSLITSCAARSTSSSAHCFTSSRCAGLDHAVVFETAGIHRDRIALGPVLVQLAIGIAGVVQLVVFPRRRLILAEIQHVVVMRVAAHAHRDDLDQRRSLARARAFGRPGERGGNFVGIGAVDGQAGNAVAERPCRRRRASRSCRAPASRAPSGCSAGRRSRAASPRRRC